MFRMDELLLLEHLTYLTNTAPLRQILGCDGMTVSELLEAINMDELVTAKDYGSFITGYDWHNILTAISKNPRLMSVRIVCTHMDTWQGGGGGISAVMISQELGEAIVAFRGTAPAEWADDFAGANVTETIQQKNALQWYRQVYYHFKLSRYDVTIIGHSKGGNKAKYITVLDDTPKRCVSFDGQGFSDKFIHKYEDRIRIRQSVIENHNIDYDYVNILLNDIGVRSFYQGYDYGRGGLAESHCPNTFFEFKEGGEYEIRISEKGQSPEMQELDKFLNSYTRSMPSDDETTESTILLGQLVERAFNLKARGEKATDFFNYICDLVCSDTYNDNVGFLLAFTICYERKHPEFLAGIKRVLSFFDMDGLTRYIEMVESLMRFPGLGKMIGFANFFSNHLPEKVYKSMQSYLKDRFGVEVNREQLEGMLSIIHHLQEQMHAIRITDEGLDLVVK